MVDMDINTEWKIAIKVVAVGKGGARAVAKMAGRIANIDFFGTMEGLVVHSQQIAVGSDLVTAANEGGFTPEILCPALSNTDLLFLVTWCEDSDVTAAARQLVEAARQEGVLVLGITPSSEPAGVLGGIPLVRVHPTAFVPGDEVVPLIFGTPSLTDYLMRHAVERVTALTSEQGIICIDFADIKALMERSGDIYMAIGVAGGPTKGTDAALNALKGLIAQNVEAARISGLTASIMGSTNMTMDDFDAAASVLHAAIAEETDLLFGCHFDDGLGDNMKVTVLANYSRTELVT